MPAPTRDNHWQWLAVTHTMSTGTNLDGAAPDLEPVYAPGTAGFKGHLVYRALTNGGLFVPPGDEVGQFIQVTGFMLNTGVAALGGLTYTVEILPLARAAGGGLMAGGGDPGPSHLWRANNVAGSAGIILGPDERVMLPPHWGVRVITAGVAAGERIAATCIFEKYRDAVASYAI